MGMGILAAELRRFMETGKTSGKNPVWKRWEGFNLTCGFVGATKSASALFFFQQLSMPCSRDSLDRWKRRNNAENILKIKEMPGNSRIAMLIDGIEPGEFDETFRDDLGLAEKYGILELYKAPDGGGYRAGPAGMM
jgi:hypothetical protein